MKKAQSDMEYLLILGGAIAVAVIAIALIIAIASSSEDETILAVAHGLCAKYPDQQCEQEAVAVRERFFSCELFNTNACRALRAEPIDSCAAGFVSGKNYYLTENIDATTSLCFNFTQPNVMLNCKKKDLKLNGSAAIGIIINPSAQNVTIKNCNILTDKFGIWILNSSNNTIQNNLIRENFGNGINDTDNGVVPILLNGGSDNKIIKNNVCGVRAEASSIVISSPSPQHPQSGENTCDTCAESFSPQTVCPCDYECR